MGKITLLMILIFCFALFSEENKIGSKEGLNSFIKNELKKGINSREEKLEWNSSRQKWLNQLKEKCFFAWPKKVPSTKPREIFNTTKSGIKLRAIEFTGLVNKTTLLIAHHPELEDPDLVVLNPLDANGWEEFKESIGFEFSKFLREENIPKPNHKSFSQHQKMFKSFKWVMAYIKPNKLIQETSSRENLQLQNLGHSPESIQVWNTRLAIQTLRETGKMKHVPLWLQAQGRMAGVSLYASLFEPDITRLDLYNLPKSHINGPFFPNISRVIGMPQAVALALENSKIVIYQKDSDGWTYPKEIASKLKWEHQLQIRKIPPSQ